MTTAEGGERKLPAALWPQKRTAEQERERWLKRREAGYKKPARTSAQRATGNHWKRRIIAIDSEGWGEDEYGRQQSMLWVAVSNEEPTALSTSRPSFSSYLYTGERLKTQELLDWLWSMPPGHLTGFSISYDVSMLLMDVPIQDLERLLKPELRLKYRGGFMKGKPRGIFYGGYELEWLPGKCLTLRKDHKARTWWDSFPFYQRSFLETLKKTRKGVFPEDMIETVIAHIEAGKQRRGEAVHDWEEELRYARYEMWCLSRLQADLFRTCEEVGLPLTQFHGPGSLAAKAMAKEKVDQSLPEDFFLVSDAGRRKPRPVEERQGLEPLAAREAYVGGRFEMPLHGRFEELWKQDIISAYTAATRSLPCLAHGRWKEWRWSKKEPLPPRGIVGFYRTWWKTEETKNGLWGPFPVRAEKDPIWPYNGHNWIVSTEFWAAQWMEGRFEVSEALLWVQECEHQPFAWVDRYFEERQAWKAAEDGREKVFKHVLSSVYGKVCQSIGSAPYHSWVWSSMVTAGTRAQLLEAIGKDPAAAVMVATDGIFSTRPLELDFGKKLGQWETEKLTNVLLVQPGFYVGTNEKGEQESRARGIPDRYVDWKKFWNLWERVQALVQGEVIERGRGDTWKEWAESVTIPRFIGLKKAIYLGKDAMMGKWRDEETFFAFYSHKRPIQRWDGEHIVTFPPDYHPGGRQLIPYDHDLWQKDKVLVDEEGPVADEWGFE